jgi:branched-chain amino acid transport system substrate-binding protein
MSGCRNCQDFLPKEDKMQNSKASIAVCFAACLVAGIDAASAQEVKVGVALPYSGIGAELGQKIDRGIELYLAHNAETIKPYKITLIKRDTKAPNGAAARSVVQDLILQDKVDILAGFLYSPDAFAAAPLITAARKVAIVMNAGTAQITNASPDFVRVSFSMWHASYTMGEAAAKTLHAKTAIIGYRDDPPGKDSRDAFRHAFEASGGKVIDEIPMGSSSAVPDFTPYFQRAKEQKPDVFFIFSGSEDHAPAALRTYNALGMREAGIKLIATGDSAPDSILQTLGPGAIGMMTMHHYDADLDTPLNRDFLAAYKKKYGENEVPDFMTVAGYDGMAAIVHAVKSLNGDLSEAEKVLSSLKGWTFESPRGPITIDPATRDIIMNEYLAETEMTNGRLQRKNLSTIAAVKDPCKELKVGPCAVH